jgi:predicted unusual protein kinase regulating ubiquinone biosynthesis (AarF/ABC1/UbiB family)
MALAADFFGLVNKATLNTDNRVAVKIQHSRIDTTIHHNIEILTLLLLKMPIPELKKKKAHISTNLAECQKILR